jgi:hypothetical protein
MNGNIGDAENGQNSPVLSGGQSKIRVVPDTCFWIGLAGLDFVDRYFRWEKKKARMDSTAAAFRYFRENMDRIEFVMTDFLRDEIDVVCRKILKRAKNKGLAEPYVREIKRKISALMDTIDKNVTPYDIDSGEYINAHPELPVLPVEEGRTTENPDRHLFAIAQALGDIPGGASESIILTVDMKHVISTGKYRNTTPLSPDLFEDVAEMIFYMEEKKAEKRAKEERIAQTLVEMSIPMLDKPAVEKLVEKARVSADISLERKIREIQAEREHQKAMREEAEEETINEQLRMLNVV